MVWGLAFLKFACWTTGTRNATVARSPVNEKNIIIIISQEIREIVKDRIIDGVILQDSGFYLESLEKEVLKELEETNIPLFIIEKKCLIILLHMQILIIIKAVK